jgi:putative ABC transport system permease protein
VANLRQHRLTSVLSSLSIAVAAFLILSLSGFVSRYEKAVDAEVAGLGYDMLITARGCPYEAATLMLRGGVGLRYMPAGSLGKIRSDPDIAAVFPTLIHPVRDPASDTGMLLFRGVSAESFAARGLVFEAGSSFEQGVPGLVLGYAIAELEQLRVGDSFLIPEGLGRPAISVPVVGVLARNGGQEDGSLMLSVEALQVLFSLEDKLTGVGVQLSPGARSKAQEVQDRYEQDPALQGVQLSAVLKRLRQATDQMRSLVWVLSGFVGFLALGLILVTAVLRASAAHAEVRALHAAGLSKRFLFLAAVVENALLLGVGLCLGALATVLAGPALATLLGAQLAYLPDAAVVGLSWRPLSVLAGLCLGFSFLAALPRWFRLGSRQSLRGA